MTQGPSDDWSGSDHDDGRHGRRSHRVTLLARTAGAVRHAHAFRERAASSRAVAEDAFRSALENHALLEAEREARDEATARHELADVVREFAHRLRADGAPPEVAVRRLKSVVEPAIFSGRDHDGSDVEWRRAVASDVVTWFVEAYYAA